MIELYIGQQPLKIKSNIDIRVGTVEAFNSSDAIDMDIVSLARILYPKHMLSSGSNATVADRAVAKENNLHFVKNFQIMDFVNLIKQNPHVLEFANPKLTTVEKQYAAILKKRKPLKINQKLYARYIEEQTLKKNTLAEKWQPHFMADINQKTDTLRYEIGERYGIDPNKISKESVSTSELSLEDKSELFEIMEIFNLQQELSNLERLNGHSEYNFSLIPFGSVSGRSSTFGENIHGMTKGQFGIFSKKENGMRLVSIDFSQIELRLAASLWGDAAMQAVFHSGGDIHVTTAKNVGGSDRELAKALNYGLLYGMGWQTFMVYCAKDFGIIISPEDAKRYVENFKKSYPMLFDKNTTEFTGLSYKTKTLGREMHAQDIWGGAYDIKKHTIMRNIQIQGEGADILKMAVVYLDQRLRGIGEIAFEMYDEIGFWIKDTETIMEEVNAICDELTAYIQDFSGFYIPVELSKRF